MSWRVARSLLTLRDQVNRMAPDRDKSSDGTIGDERHQTTKSEHNPDANGVVRAMDITHDPAHGVDARKLAEALVASRDTRILYLISNAQIVSSVVQPWIWRRYNGINPHRHHMHISVVTEPHRYDDIRLAPTRCAISSCYCSGLACAKAADAIARAVTARHEISAPIRRKPDCSR